MLLNLIKSIFSSSPKGIQKMKDISYLPENIANAIKKNAAIIDVRSSSEFNGGHIENSINIPVNEIPNQVNKLKAMKKPIILVCASGGRSGMALQMLKDKGLTDIHNAGSWINLINAQ